MVGLAIVIAVGQLDKILGIESEGGNVLQELGSMLEQLADWDWPTLAIGAAALAALFLIERFLPKVPGALVVMLVAIALSALLNWEDSGIHVVGEIPAELPKLGLPEWPGWDLMSDIMVGALAVIVVAFAESYAAAKTYASKFGYQVDPNQEMIGLGAANLGAGLSGGFVVDGSLSKTAAGVDAGQKTQMTSIFTAVFVLITIVALTWLFEPLPEAVLGAIVIHAVWKLIDFSGFVLLWNTRKIDFALAVAAFLGVILIDILQGILIGIILSLLALIYRASFPEGAELGRLEDEEGNYEFVDVIANPDAETLPGLVIYRQTGSLIFSNAAAFSQQARELLWARTDPPASVLVVDCEQMADMDVTGAGEIIELNEELRASAVEMWLVRLHGDALTTAQNAGVTEVIGEENVMPTIRLAGQRLRSRTSPEEGPPPEGTPDDRPD
jgi:MFS superfamily sulfate permease-like transporter